MKPILLGTLLILLNSLQVAAQKQPGIPQPRGPVDLSDTSNLVIFVILPIVVLVLFFLWRRAMKKRKAEENENAQDG
ncbi:hypothetical protein SAMN04488057_103319 [Cyclobacterium lianum]|uniref:Adenylosuccinate synthetase n=1 Tax=Cyclobacterium lianum TaxID=388280 RepID=A0A1M7LKA9_9BACT|nr:hypothetical protein [Cyclobacterium lianum]SHM78563.1 hypothetical protein SAMN04488057_103319 [Cyclobacterium lianum]